ncbi:patatin-like phospholipase family protein [Nostoc sp. C110]|uniref:patatin-like phospholipase family protein n=1 Tax=Nostoc sp. C110 TaxID=3349876 RepID=UPI00370D71DA
MSNKYRILSIDGGGIRGIIPAVILAEIERRTSMQIFEMFDLIAGTSTGGILALGLTKPYQSLDKPSQSSQSKSQYSAEDLVNLYKDEGKYIFNEQETVVDKMLELIFKQFQEFSKHFPQPLHLPEIDVNSLKGPKFSSTGREKVLERFLGETPINQALKEVMIPSYDTELRTPIFFTSNAHSEKLGTNFRKICKEFTMVQAAMATSAAPTYFAPYLVPKPKFHLNPNNQENDYYSLIDGGIFANNPTSLAIMEAIISYQKSQRERLSLDNILVVSLGTGSLTRKYFYNHIKNWGLLSWVEPILNIVFDGQSESVSCQLEQLLPESEGNPKQFFRFQALLTEANDNIDDVSEQNIGRLESLAKQIIKDRNKDFENLCNILKEVRIR